MVLNPPPDHARPPYPYAKEATVSDDRAVSPWRTIDSAPKDGTPFLAFNSFKRTIVDASVKVVEDGESWKVGDWIFFADIAPELIPTHWMPRPPLPGAKP